MQSKFKVGDIVSIKKDLASDAPVNAGDQGTIQYITSDENECFVRIDTSTEVYWFKNEHLNLINSPASLASRHNNGKLRPTLFPVNVYRECLKVLKFGADKYGDYNWQKGFHYLNCADSLERHWMEWKDGQDKDDESKLWHLAHVIVNATFLLYYQLMGTYTHLDNRKKTNPKEESNG